MKFLSDFLRRIQNLDRLEALELELSECKTLISEQSTKIWDFKKALESSQFALDKACDELEKIKEVDELEVFWNNKRKKTSWMHPARPMFGKQGSNVLVDPRIYCHRDSKIYAYKSGTNDEKALNCFRKVRRDVTYVADLNPGEFWQFAFETLERKKGDCEDGAIYMYVMMLNSGIPYWRIRLNAGDVQGGGHAYLTYLREEDNQWYILDWCYWPKESDNFGKTWKEAKKYFGIWGSWNSKYMYGQKPV